LTTFRLFAVTLKDYFRLDYDLELSGSMAWACWTLPLLLAEVLLQANKIMKSPTIRKASMEKSLV
jgi:hypothetical protein